MRLLNVIQSWDDGVVDDVRLTDLLRKHNARASFNLNPGLHGKSRGHGWMYRDKEVLRLSRSELIPVYDGFEIANHTMTHPDLAQASPDSFQREIMDARNMLQDWFGQAVTGFCYPYGNATNQAQRVIETSGHAFARDARGLGNVNFDHAYHVIKPHAYFSDNDFEARYESARASGSYFFFWGHSYEVMSELQWDQLEQRISRISHDEDAEWVTLGEFVNAQA